jgi:2,5-dioxopentanoate dehydrogenase
MITGKNYVGNIISASGDVNVKTINPQLNTENKWTFTKATPEEVNRAVVLASKAFKTYSEISNKGRAYFLNTIADELLSLGDVLLDTYCIESGYPRGRAEGERGRMISQFRLFAQMVEEGNWVNATIDTAIPSRQPVPKDDIRKMLVPIGPIVVFGSSNFPFAFSTGGGDTASALAAGCTVIVKGHPMHLGTSELVASAIISAAEKANMPSGVFSYLVGEHEVGKSLVEHPLVKGVGFTGSIKGGRALVDLAAKREELIPVFTEMGSVNPVIVMPEAVQKNSKKWSVALSSSITLGTGQFCTNPGLILGIKSPSFDSFINDLGDEIQKIAPSCMLHPSIADNFNKGKKGLQEDKTVRIEGSYKGELKANYVSQTLLSVEGKSFLKNKNLSNEVFGPLSIVVKCDNEAQLIEVISVLEGQLTGTIIGEDNEIINAKDIISVLQSKVGRIIFNGVPTGVEVCPSMHHGGPYPASSDSRFTSVGIHAVNRWMRPFSFQNWPNELLPLELQNENPLEILRIVNNKATQLPITNV